MITINRTSPPSLLSTQNMSTANLLQRHGSVSNSPNKAPRNAVAGVNKTYLNNLASSAHMNSGKLVLQGAYNSPTSRVGSKFNLQQRPSILQQRNPYTEMSTIDDSKQAHSFTGSKHGILGMNKQRRTQSVLSS